MRSIYFSSERMGKLEFEKNILRIICKWFSDTHYCLPSLTLSSEKLINHKCATRVEI